MIRALAFHTAHIGLLPWAILLGLTAGASALEPLSLEGLGGLPIGEEGKRLSVFAGAAWGTDSNPRRAEDPSEIKSESVTEYTAALVLQGGNDRRSYKLAYQGRFDVLESLDFEEHSATAMLATHSEKLNLNLRGKLALLADPTDPDLAITGDLVRRFVRKLSPDVSINFGRLEIAGGYLYNSIIFEGDFSWLDYEETCVFGEMRWWRGESAQFFLRNDLGSAEGRFDFEYERLCAGWRSESPRKSAVELGLGMQSLHDFSGGAAADETRFFGQLRTTRILSGGRASLDFVCANTSEPSASSAYKNVLAVQVRYRRTSSRRFGWGIGLLADRSEMISPDAGTPDEFLRLIGELQIGLDIGSLSGTRGRIYASVAYESRDADGSQFDYDRLRFLAGVALVR